MHSLVIAPSERHIGQPVGGLGHRSRLAADLPHGRGVMHTCVQPRRRLHAEQCLKRQDGASHPPCRIVAVGAPWLEARPRRRAWGLGKVHWRVVPRRIQLVEQMVKGSRPRVALREEARQVEEPLDRAYNRRAVVARARKWFGLCRRLGDDGASSHPGGDQEDGDARAEAGVRVVSSRIVRLAPSGLSAEARRLLVGTRCAHRRRNVVVEAAGVVPC